jgi:hypothetical protein
MRTERAKILELPNDLRLVGYLCRLRFCWQVCLRVDELDGRLFAVVATFNIKDAAPDGWWEIGRHEAGLRISAWIAENGNGVKITKGVELEKAA